MWVRDRTIKGLTNLEKYVYRGVESEERRGSKMEMIEEFVKLRKNP